MKKCSLLGALNCDEKSMFYLYIFIGIIKHVDFVMLMTAYVNAFERNNKCKGDHILRRFRLKVKKLHCWYIFLLLKAVRSAS